jgi:CheY-like chemotaxis protein
MRMNRPKIVDSTLLIASDKPDDANVVKKLLEAEFGRVFISTNVEHAAVDFDHCRPDVIILAFNGLENAERYYLGLYRHDCTIHLNLHRAIVLCSKDEVDRAYQLCSEGIFDDYMLFWPMTNDPLRLPMTVHLALREMRTKATGDPSAADFAVQIKRMSTFGSEMTRQLEQGNKHIESINHAVKQGDSEANAAFEKFSQRLVQNELPGVTVLQLNDDLQNEIGRVKQEIIDAPRNKLKESVTPLKNWAGEMNETAAPHMESLQVLNELAEKVPPVLLVVDDEAFQHKILGFMLKEARYQVMFASSIAEAMTLLYEHELPNLILMDVMLPGINGLEGVRQIKMDKNLAGIPIIMMTGKSEKEILQASLEAGACDFIVKPFASNTLLSKLDHALMKPDAVNVRKPQIKSSVGRAEARPG